MGHLHDFVFLGVIFVASVTGILGSLMGKAILHLMNWKRKFSAYQNWMYVAICALLLVFVSLDYKHANAGIW